MSKYNSALALEDGKVFFGWGFGCEKTSLGELCFSTSQTGYQEAITDPSYQGQIIVFAFPHIGNVGVNLKDMESNSASISGMVLRCEPTAPSSWRSEDSLQNFMEEHQVPGIWGLDTRQLIRHLRKSGPKNAVLVYGKDFTYEEQDLVDIATSALSYDEIDFVKKVTCKKPYTYSQGNQKEHHVVVMDFGVKRNILRLLDQQGMKVTVVPADTELSEIMKWKPAGIVISNGPGNPNLTDPKIMDTIRAMIEATDLPILGICLGFQLLAIALGSKITKMKQGHRGINQPCYHIRDKCVAIGSHNHGFSLCKEHLNQEIQPFSVSLFDDCIEGFSARKGRIMAVQYHPEASPGPQENANIFREFASTVLCRLEKT